MQTQPMTILCYVKKWLPEPPITGNWSLVAAVAAIALPTIIRMLVDDMVTGIVFSTYIPFVLLSAILLGWRHATAIALASAIIADLLFLDPRYVFLAGPTDVFGMIVFLVTSGLTIGLVQIIRSAIRDGVRPVGSGDGIIFSLDRGHAWASWRGASYYLRLGPQDEVAEMMKDYLAQVDVGRRLNRTTQ